MEGRSSDNNTGEWEIRVVLNPDTDPTVRVREVVPEPESVQERYGLSHDPFEALPLHDTPSSRFVGVPRPDQRVFEGTCRCGGGHGAPFCHTPPGGFGEPRFAEAADLAVLRNELQQERRLNRRLTEDLEALDIEFCAQNDQLVQLRQTNRRLVIDNSVLTEDFNDAYADINRLRQELHRLRGDHAQILHTNQEVMEENKRLRAQLKRIRELDEGSALAIRKLHDRKR